ncbi:glutathione S-transferase [Paraburkholderia bannensis]|uniref:Glutathione S-transferase n=1 Tax=Paraburkholderia bannensis TaxID=765414 RepID=A0A7W9U296_9BURK|nr:MULTISPECIES: glutathione transferase GstA [Paraburkholderia]MBB3260777.1 glutathione S-transferase [Paraburkholderia sp. WP4_3_2]MBB6105682.1 glutathione S-transferase [Paraburkholderia bannensis]
MKLYFSPGACSLASHIVAREAGLDIELDQVNLGNKETASGKDFRTINAKGCVPALELDNGELLTEGPAIMQYLADRNPASGLAPAHDSIARYRLQEMLGFISTELHKRYSPLFNPNSLDSVRAESIAALQRQYGLLDKRLAEHEWLVGDHFTAADAYLFTVTNWAAHVGLDLSAFPAVLTFQKRVAARPAVQAALGAEGLIPKQ